MLVHRRRHTPFLCFSVSLFLLLLSRVPSSYCFASSRVVAWSISLRNRKNPIIPCAVNRRHSTPPCILKRHMPLQTASDGSMEGMAENDNMDGQNASGRGEEECPIDAPPGFCSKYDDLGCPVFETDADAFSSSMPDDDTNADSVSASVPCIRLQATPDACLRGMTSAADVEEKIRQVREEMGRHCNSDLYTRQWVPSPAFLGGKLKSNDFATKDACSDVKTSGARADHSFSVMQFNVLAEGLSSGSSNPLPFGKSKEHKRDDKAVFGGFTAVPNPEVCLDYNNRRWRILEAIIGRCYSREEINDAKQEINSKAPSICCPFDIIAMEEVDRFDGFFAPALALFGYQGVFNAKPRAPGVSLGYYSDGCALFWKTNTFDLVDKARKSFSTGTQVHLLATLKHKASGKIILVAVTHLKASKSEENAKIRGLQSAELWDILREKAASIADKEACDVPIIVLGDFNAEPDEAAVETFVASTDESIASFASAYPVDLPYSTWKTRGPKVVRRVIDYIFYCNSKHQLDDGMGETTTCSIECTEILALPAEGDMERHGLPGFRSPSDHLALAARFHLTCIEETKSP